MNIRSVDLQVMVSHATDAGRVQAANNQQSLTQQQQFAEHMQQLTADKQKQVQNTQAAEFGKLQAEQQENGQKKRKGRQAGTTGKADDQNPEDQVAPDPIRGHNLDIKF